MAVNGSQHRTDIDELDESAEGGPVQYRWSCFCRRFGRWTEDKAAAEKSGQVHERRYAPKPKGPQALRKLISLN